MYHEAQHPSTLKHLYQTVTISETSILISLRRHFAEINGYNRLCNTDTIAGLPGVEWRTIDLERLFKMAAY